MPTYNSFMAIIDYLKLKRKGMEQWQTKELHIDGKICQLYKARARGRYWLVVHLPTQ